MLSQNVGVLSRWPKDGSAYSEHVVMLPESVDDEEAEITLDFAVEKGESFVAEDGD